MTLTVPQAGVTAGRSANIRVVAPDTGASIAALGDIIREVGGRLEGERLDLAMGRLQVDMTRDMNALRLKYEQMGDPDAIVAQLPGDLASLKASYLDAKGADGRARVDPKLRDRFGLAFDDLAARHEFALGTNVIALHRSQQAADYVTWQATASAEAANAAPETRDALIAENDARVDAQVKSNAMSYEDGAKAKLEFRRKQESTDATAMMDDDPQGVIDAVEGNLWPTLGPEKNAQLRAQAEGEIARREKAALDDQAAAAKETVAAWKSEITEGLSVIKAGGTWARSGMLDDPDVIAALPDQVAEARGAVALAAEGIERMSLAELRDARAAEAAAPKTRKWQTERLAYLDARIAEVEKAQTTDDVGFWTASTPGLLPPLDLSAPETAAASLRGRVARTGHMVETGRLAEGHYLSEAERAALKPMLDPSVADGQTRLMWAEALLAADAPKDGIDAAQALAAQAGATPAFQQALALLADGAAPETLLPILRGEVKSKSGQANLPPPKELVRVFSEVTKGIFDDNPRAAERVLGAAAAIFADEIGDIDPEDIANGTWDDGPARGVLLGAAQRALGATLDGNGEVVAGGIVEIGGSLVPLPRGVPVAAVEDTLERVGHQLSGLNDPLRTGGVSVRDITPGSGTGPQGNLSAADPYRGLKAASLVPGAFPDLGDDPDEAWGNLRIEPAGLPGQDAYVLVEDRGGQPWIVETGQGEPFYFSLAALIRSVPR